MDNRAIGFFDSGLGGLPYLAWAKRHLPDEHFVYLADTAHFPYGEKSASDVRAVVLSGIAELFRLAEPKLVVVACNTASVVALSELRHEFHVPFVGVVPAVKPAAAGSTHRRIALLATNRTVDDAYVAKLIQSFASGCSVTLIADERLVRFIEREYDERDHERTDAALRPVLDQIKACEADSVVLACTHFTLLDAAFRRALGDTVALIDSREGAGKQIVRLVRELRLEACERGEDRFYLTGPEDERYRRFATAYGLHFEGRPVVGAT